MIGKGILAIVAGILISGVSAFALPKEEVDKETKERILKRVQELMDEHEKKLKKEVEEIVKEELAKAKKGESPAKEAAGKPFLGIKTEELDEQKGLKVVTVVEGGPAAKAGLKADDIIVAVNGEKTLDQASFGKFVLGAKPGDVLKIDIKRGENEEKIAVKLGLRPKEKE